VLLQIFFDIERNVLYPYFRDELLTLREYRGGGMMATKENATNYNYINTASLLIRPLIIDTFISTARQSTHTIQPFFSRGTVRSDSYISQNSSVNAIPFSHSTLIKSFIRRSTPLALPQVADTAGPGTGSATLSGPTKQSTGLGHVGENLIHITRSHMGSRNP
jgi:hypothetical protein